MSQESDQMAWYEGFHARDAQVDKLDAKIKSAAKVIAALREALGKTIDAAEAGGIAWMPAIESARAAYEQNVGETK
jgi:hypothetical protein